MISLQHIGSSQRKALQLFGVCLALLLMEIMMMVSYNAFYMVK